MTEEKNTKSRFNFQGLFLLLLGIALGGIFTFYWNDLAQFVGNDYGFILLAILVITALYLIGRIIGKYLTNEVDQSIERIGIKTKEAIKNPDQVPQKLRDITQDLKPFLSLWTLNKLLSLVILAMATVLGGIIAIQANKLIDNQNKIVEDQNMLFDTQNRYVAQELEKIIEQTNFFEKQTDLLDSQLVKMSIQNDLVLDQNYLIGLQKIQVDSQISLLAGQNSRIDTQNYRINLQNNLLEADRRGALIILMSNILDQVNSEIEALKEVDQAKYDSIGYYLSDPLIGRIAALSQGFLPYRYLINDTLSTEAVSPERGQLLLALAKSNLDKVTYNKINSISKFDKAYLRNSNLSSANLIGAKLSGANLSYANLSAASLVGTDFWSANLLNANLSFANLYKALAIEADFTDANLISADLSDANLTRAVFIGAILNYADLNNAILRDANFDGASLAYTNLEFTSLGRASLKNTDFKDANLFMTNLTEADLSGTINLTFGQLKKARSLYGCVGLDSTTKAKIEREKPCLFMENGCR